MKNKSLIISLFLILALTALACLSSSGESEDILKAEEQEESKQSKEAAQEEDEEENIIQLGTGNVLFSDDFSDPDSGWDRYSDETVSTDYTKDGYLITINAPSTSTWSNPYMAFQDVSVEVYTKFVGGEKDNNYGIICRYKDISNFYALVISSDGYYGIRKTIDGSDLELVGSTEMLPSKVINGNGKNTLRADCIGDTFTLYVNGEILMQVKDASIPYGDVGLYTGTFDAESTSILFKDFVVRLP